MRIFDIFKESSRKLTLKKGVNDQHGRDIPTVPMPNGLPEAYCEVFRSEITTITVFPRHDIDAMLNIIMNGEGGHLNQGRYHKAVFEQYFKNRDWHWPEFEYWKCIFNDTNQWPAGLQVRKDKDADLYPLLMRTILFRSKGLHQRRQEQALGIASWKLRLTFEEDRRLVEIALAENPHAIPPFFPGDLSGWRPDITSIKG